MSGADVPEGQADGSDAAGVAEPHAPGTDGDVRRPRPPRLDPLAVRRLLKAEGLRARHSLSQNFLADPDVLQSILDLASPAAGERVLEVGPGLGVLTGGLLEAGASVTAVELDRRLAERLRTSRGADIDRGRLRLVEGDILDQDLESLIERPYSVVANVPYHITSPILHRFLGNAAARPDRMVLMLQREVAERIAAAPGDMSYLSVFVQFHARVRVAFVVPRSAFEPEPEVESAVVEIATRPLAGEAGRHEAAAGELALAASEEGDLWRLVQAGFHERRKKLHNVLTRQLALPGDLVAEALAAAGIDGDRRPQTLSVEDWLALRETLGPLPGSPSPPSPAHSGTRPGSRPGSRPGARAAKPVRGRGRR